MFLYENAALLCCAAPPHQGVLSGAHVSAHLPRAVFRSVRQPTRNTYPGAPPSLKITYVRGSLPSFFFSPPPSTEEGGGLNTERVACGRAREIICPLLCTARACDTRIHVCCCVGFFCGRKTEPSSCRKASFVFGKTFSFSIRSRGGDERSCGCRGGEERKRFYARSRACPSFFFSLWRAGVFWRWSAVRRAGGCAPRGQAIGRVACAFARGRVRVISLSQLISVARICVRR